MPRGVVLQCGLCLYPPMLCINGLIKFTPECFIAMISFKKKGEGDNGLLFQGKAQPRLEDKKQIRTNKLPTDHSPNTHRKYRACHFGLATIIGSMSYLQGSSKAVCTCTAGKICPKVISIEDMLNVPECFALCLLWVPLVWHGPWQESVFKGFELVGLGLICCKALSSLSFCFSRRWGHGQQADLRSLLSCSVPWTKGQRQLKDTSASSSLLGKVMRCFRELSYWWEQGGRGEHLQHLLSYYTTLFLREPTSPGEIHVAVPNTLWTQLMIWAVKCLRSKK